ncbi:DUF397 domain-containing protein [Streptomyces thermolineatus]|uniref:DUF397 domain-containing protein n=1 Tax=Streptomyces thermolineatus TaxID=44033 RepID=A0ABN3L9U6_9ACTN
MTDPTGFEFRKSSYSGATGECIEVARNITGVVALRDSKNPAGPVLTVPAMAWSAFVAGIRRSAFPHT